MRKIERPQPRKHLVELMYAIKIGNETYAQLHANKNARLPAHSVRKLERSLVINDRVLAVFYSFLSSFESFVWPRSNL